MQLRREKESLEYDLKISQMDPQEAFAKLREKVTDDKARTEELEGQIESAQEVSMLRWHVLFAMACDKRANRN
eukprot:scaffold286_cov247-Pinguiococcus_pyrenoidosus.AAC.10